MSNNYFYRFKRLDETGLRGIIERYVPNGRAFSGNLIELRPIHPYDKTSPLEKVGTFGHAFNDKSEVRWKRDAKGTFDVLLLSAESHAEIGAASQTSGEWATSDTKASIFLNTPKDSRLGYVEYVAPNGAVQFVRYTEVK